jgi:hypothetical protein
VVSSSELRVVPSSERTVVGKRVYRLHSNSCSLYLIF